MQTSKTINDFLREMGVAKMETTTPTCKESLQVGNEHKPMTLDEAIAHAEEMVNDTPCGREHKQLADWLKKLREIKISNAAKRREALEEIRDATHIWITVGGISARRTIEMVADIAAAALSEPPRNCDRYRTLADALDAWRDIDPREAVMFDD